MADKADITPAMLRQLLDYDPETGLFVWRPRDASWFTDAMRTADQQARGWNTTFAGKSALTHRKKGYLQGVILGCGFSAHRVALAIQYGHWPKYIDHINGVPSDNRICNLRDVTSKENQRN